MSKGEKKPSTFRPQPPKGSRPKNTFYNYKLTKHLFNFLEKKIKSKYSDIQIESPSFIGGKIWVNLLIPNALNDNEDFNDFLANLSTDILLESKKLVIFNTISQEKK